MKDGLESLLKQLPSKLMRHTLIFSTVLALALGFCLSLLLTPTPEVRARADRSDSEQMIIDIYKRANAAVVNLNIKTVQQDFFFPVFQEGSGSGVIIDEERALVVTNFHEAFNRR